VEPAQLHWKTPKLPFVPAPNTPKTRFWLENRVEPGQSGLNSRKWQKIMKSAWTASESGWRAAAPGLKSLHLLRAEPTDYSRTPLITRRYLGSPLTNSLMTKWSMSGVSLSFGPGGGPRYGHLYDTSGNPKKYVTEQWKKEIEGQNQYIKSAKTWKQQVFGPSWHGGVR